MKIDQTCLLAGVAILLGTLTGCRPAHVQDEAKAAGKTVADFPASDVDYFHGMDDNVKLTPDEVKGRNTWVIWTGGNEAFWDYMSRNGYGLIDFLKTIDSRKRSTRFHKAGMINEPGYRAATTPDEFGLYLDQPVDPAQAQPDPKVYGKSAGVFGFRVYPNPKFDAQARKNWDANRYYNDLTYAQNPKLIRPYRVGMTCAICHVSFHPLHPPSDMENPQMGELTSTLGNQYFRTLGVFGQDLKPNNFLYHLLRSAPPGTVDTSIIATDNNNNPNIINSIFNLEARLGVARTEHVGPGALLLPGGTDPNRPVPHVLVDGADSIGIQGALVRVFVNIGTFGEEWIRCHNPLVGNRQPKPFRIAYAQENSVYWQATEKHSLDLAKFLIKASRPMPLKNAPGGERFLTADENVLNRGRIAFAENCMACHSSKRPAAEIAGPPEKWRDWAHSPAFVSWAREEVMKPDFLDNNYLSTDARYPITLLQTNAGRALQDNATAGHIWSEFSSDNYKQDPPVGEIDVVEPFSGKSAKFSPPGGGPGYYRVPTLVSIWNGAPFLHNNQLGDYNGDPSVEGRMNAFNDAMTKMFWAERRPGSALIARTTERSWLMLPAYYLPVAVEGIMGAAAHPFLTLPWLLPVIVLLVAAGVFALGGRLRRQWVRRSLRTMAVILFLVALGLVPACYFAAGKLGDVKLGPFPTGTPVNVIGSLNPQASQAKLLPALYKTFFALRRIDKDHLSDEDGLKLFNREAGPALWAVSKNPDWVEDRGHYFAQGLSDEDKRALIEYMKTF